MPDQPQIPPAQPVPPTHAFDTALKSKPNFLKHPPQLQGHTIYQPKQEKKEEGVIDKIKNFFSPKMPEVGQLPEQSNHQMKDTSGTAILDASDFQVVVVFAPGYFANVVRTVMELPNHLRFYLVPQQATNVMLNLEQEKSSDPRYNAMENYYVFDFPKAWIKPMNHHQLFQKWYAYTDWNMSKFINPNYVYMEELVEKADRLQEERDNNYAKYKQLLRKDGLMSRHEAFAKKEKVKEVADITSQLSSALVGNKPGQEGGK
jgi:hypothetical protein